MNLLRQTYFLAFSLTFAIGVAQFAQAGPAEDYVRSKHTSLTATLNKPASPARQTAVNQLLDGFFDFDRLTKDALGKHYDEITQAEFNELKSVVQELVTKNYRKNIEKTLNFDVKFTGEQETTPGKEWKVRSSATKRGSNEQPVEINYAIHKVDDKYVVFDIETEGSSMLRNYRNQFGKTIRKDGFRALIKKLRDRVAKS